MSNGYSNSTISRVIEKSRVGNNVSGNNESMSANPGKRVQYCSAPYIPGTSERESREFLNRIILSYATNLVTLFNLKFAS